MIYIPQILYTPNLAYGYTDSCCGRVDNLPDDSLSSKDPEASLTDTIPSIITFVCASSTETIGTGSNYDQPQYTIHYVLTIKERSSSTRAKLEL